MKGISIPEHDLLESLREGTDRIVFRGRFQGSPCVTRVILRPVPLPLGGLISGVVQSGHGSLAGLDDEVMATLEGYRVRCRLGPLPGLPEVLQAGLAHSSRRCPTGTGLPFVTTRWIPGRTLGAAAENRAQREGALQALLGILQTLHEANTVYGDLKPSNIVLHGSEAHIIDLDTLREVAGARHPIQVTHRTPQYAAPEQEATPPLSYPASDIFTFGLVVCELLAGVRRGEVGFPPALPPPWNDIVDACFRSRPLDRPTARSILAALNGTPGPLPGWDGTPLFQGTEPVRDATQPVPEPVRDATQPVPEPDARPPLPPPPVFDANTRTISKDGTPNNTTTSVRITRAGPVSCVLPEGASAFLTDTVTLTCPITLSGARNADNTFIQRSVMLSTNGEPFQRTAANWTWNERDGRLIAVVRLDIVPVGTHRVRLKLWVNNEREGVIVEAELQRQAPPDPSSELPSEPTPDLMPEIPAPVASPQAPAVSVNIPPEPVSPPPAAPDDADVDADAGSARPRRRKGGLWLWLVVLVVLGGMGGLLGGVAMLAVRYRSWEQARARSEAIMAALKEHKTVEARNGLDTLGQLVAETEAALNELETPELLGLYALERVWQQTWHWSGATWNDARFTAGKQVVEHALEAGETPAALLAKGVLYGGACRTMPERQGARRLKRCEISLEALSAAAEGLPGDPEMDWFYVEVMWASVMTRWAMASYLSEGALDQATQVHEDALQACHDGLKKIDAAPVNGRYLMRECIATAGALQQYGLYLDWSSWVLDEDLDRTGRRNQDVATRIIQAAHPDCAELDADGRERTFDVFAQGGVEEMCRFIGLVALGCTDRASQSRRCRFRHHGRDGQPICIDPVEQEGVPWDAVEQAALTPVRADCYWDD